MNINVHKDTLITGRYGDDGQKSNICMTVVDSGNAGKFIFKSTGNLTINQDATIYTNTFSGSTGHGSDSSIEVGTLLLESGGNIDASARGQGAGGSINVAVARDLSMAGEGKYASGIYLWSLAGGNAGSLALDVGGALTLTDGALIDGETTDTATGRGADLNLVANSIELGGGGMISATSFGVGEGGNISVAADESISISGYAGYGRTSGLFCQSHDTGDAGTIYVKTPELIMTNGGTISSETYSADTGGGKGGDIKIEVDSLTLLGGSNPVRGGTTILSGTLGSGHSGNTNINATKIVTLDGQNGDRGVMISGGSSQAIGIEAGSAGNIAMTTPRLIIKRNGLIANQTVNGVGGNILLDVDSLEITGGHISTATTGRGQAGDINISAVDISVSGDSKQISCIMSNSTSSGNGGIIQVNTDNLLLENGGVISVETDDMGQAGNIDIKAGRDIILSGDLGSQGTESAISSKTNGTMSGAGNGGEILLAAKNIRVTGGAVVSVNSFGPGSAGEVTIKADKQIYLQGESSSGYASSIEAVAASKNTNGGDGDAGRIFIATNELVLEDGAYINSYTEGGGDAGFITIKAADSIRIAGERKGGTLSFIASSSHSTGDGSGSAGTIMVDTGSLSLVNGGGLSTKTVGPGAAGSITIIASDRVELTGTTKNGKPSHIWSLSEGEDNNAGNAGKIIIEAGNIILLENSSIATSAVAAGGGNISINVPDVLRLKKSSITAEVKGGNGDGGNINIDPEFVILENSKVIANAFGGNGGNIKIVADQFIATPDSKVEASSQLGIDGNVEIDSPDIDISASISVMPDTFLDRTGLLNQRCLARTNDNSSSLVVTGRGGLPAAPATLLTSPVMVDQVAFIKSQDEQEEAQ